MELGAGIGFVSSYIRRHTAAARIICVEANPTLIPYINNVHRINDVRDTIVLNGVAQTAPRDTSVPFYCRRDFWASSLTPSTGPYDSVVDVPSLNFIELLDAYQPSVLIMDIEGGELALLALAELRHVKAIVMEVHENVYGREGLEQLFAATRRLGFAEDPDGAARAVHTLVRSAPG